MLSCISDLTAQELVNQNLATTLQESWKVYKKKFVSEDGRVIDPSRSSITTSEGQSYALLRAVWLDDQKTFQLVWNWTQNNLQDKNSNLFTWKWGQKSDLSWDVLDKHYATDADQDIALALILANSRWQDPTYLRQAKDIINAIWSKEIVVHKGIPYVTAGDWAISMKNPRLNPSYLAPYTYRLFAKLDQQHNWQSVVNSSYDVIQQACQLSRLNLPPDWCNLDTTLGKITIDPDSESDHSSDYSYDAMRVPWRLAVDWNWNKEIRAKQLLERMSFLLDFWKTSKTIRASYTTTGEVRSFDQPLSGYACVLPYFQIFDPSSARQLLQERLDSQYHDGIWNPENDYYGQNWAWFGIAASNGYISVPQL